MFHEWTVARTSKCWVTLWNETASCFEEISGALEMTTLVWMEPQSSSVSCYYPSRRFYATEAQQLLQKYDLEMRRETTTFLQQILDVSKSNENIHNEEQGKTWHRSSNSSVLLSLIHSILHWHITMCLQPKGCSLLPGLLPFSILPAKWALHELCLSKWTQ